MSCACGLCSELVKCEVSHVMSFDSCNNGSKEVDSSSSNHNEHNLSVTETSQASSTSETEPEDSDIDGDQEEPAKDSQILAGFSTISSCDCPCCMDVNILIIH